VQRNDDGGAGAAAAPKYTVVRVGEHTCTANDTTPQPKINVSWGSLKMSI